MVKKLPSAWLALLPLCCAGGLSAAQDLAVPDLKFAPVPALAEVASAAHKDQIALGGFDAPSNGTNLSPSDNIAALVTFHEPGARLTQWLLFLQAVADVGKGPLPKSSPMVFYTSLGTKLEFEPAPVWVSLQTLGPFGEAEAGRKSLKPQDHLARFALDQGSLSLGLDRAAEAFLHWKDNQLDRYFSLGGTPFSDSEIKKARSLAAGAMTPGEERAIVGSIPALMSYISIFERTHGLEEILFKIVERPSLWSIIRHGGVNASLALAPERVSRAQPGLWDVPPSQAVYYLPLELQINNRHALTVTLAVTAPNPPLLACGGVLGLVAEKAGDRETYLTIRLISAHASPANSQ